MNDYNEFRDLVKRVVGNRKHKITNSVTTHEVYRMIQKSKWRDIGRPISQKDFYAIIRNINNRLTQELIEGREIKLPYKLGSIELRKIPTRVEFVDGKLKTNLPIDWDATLKLWYEDESSHKERILIRKEIKELFKIYYRRSKAEYNNKNFYTFRPMRSLKQKVSLTIREGNIDAYLMDKKIN